MPTAWSSPCTGRGFVAASRSGAGTSSAAGEDVDGRAEQRGGEPPVEPVFLESDVVLVAELALAVHRSDLRSVGSDDVEVELPGDHLAVRAEGRDPERD